jgi:hypothetical protein
MESQESKLSYIKDLDLQYKLNKEHFDLVWKAMDGYGDYRERSKKEEMIKKVEEFYYNSCEDYHLWENGEYPVQRILDAMKKFIEKVKENG